jgi:hypothetical protein
MATSITNYCGDYHILLRIKGPDDKVEIFHQLMKLMDQDWAYVGRDTVRICKRCFGMVWHAPRISPTDFKAAARQVGGIKIKIRHFASVTACRGTNVSFDYVNDIHHLSQEEARSLYRAHGITTFREKYSGKPSSGMVITLPSTGVVVPQISPAAAPAIVAAAASTSPFDSQERLIAEVLTESPTTPTASTCSLSQWPGYDGDLDGWEGAGMVQ